MTGRGLPRAGSTGNQRLAVYVRPIASEAVLLTTTSEILPGIYLFSAGAGYDLLRK